MQPQLRASLRPMDVLHFWQAAAGVGDAEHWLAVFTLDEVGMMVAMCPPKSSCACLILLRLFSPRFFVAPTRMCRSSLPLKLRAHFPQVGAAQPEPKPDQPSWLQHVLTNFVHLRWLAAQAEQKGTLYCMPVVLTASTCASASSLSGPSSGRSKVKDVLLRPLSDIQMHAVLRNVMTCMKRTHSTS